jgi:hypothetical protein
MLSGNVLTNTYAILLQEHSEVKESKMTRSATFAREGDSGHLPDISVFKIIIDKLFVYRY